MTISKMITHIALEAFDVGQVLPITSSGDNIRRVYIVCQAPNSTIEGMGNGSKYLSLWSPTED